MPSAQRMRSASEKKHKKQEATSETDKQIDIHGGFKRKRAQECSKSQNPENIKDVRPNDISYCQISLPSFCSDN
jgi:hypothetical protein